MSKMGVAQFLSSMSLGLTASGVMTDCEKFGMTWGCSEDCPQLQRGECEIYCDIDAFLDEQEGR